MLRMSKMADYAALMLAAMAKRPAATHTATALARKTGIRRPTASKLLKMLSRAGLVTSQRGAHGGYILARAPEKISAVDMIEAIEGPLALTECALAPGVCALEPICAVSSQWQSLSGTVRRVLSEITLADLLAGAHAPRFSVRREPASNTFPTPLEVQHGNA